MHFLLGIKNPMIQRRRLLGMHQVCIFAKTTTFLTAKRKNPLSHRAYLRAYHTPEKYAFLPFIARYRES